MNVKEYIESGILEAYTLGALSQAEAAEVAADVARYPELAAELQAIELSLEQYAMASAVTPPPALRDKIWDSIQATDNTKAAPAETTQSQGNTIPFRPVHTRQRNWAYAAMWAALIGSTVLNAVLFTQGRNAHEAQLSLNEQVSALRAERQQLAAEINEHRKAKDMMADTAMQTIVMHTVVKGHPMAATLYWSKASGQAFVAMNALPVPPAGMQYQLWVIQGGKPVSMGVLPGHMANTPGMQKIDMSITNGEAFAISLEKMGGNPTPTEVYVLGKA